MWIKTIGLMVTLVLGLLAAPLLVEAQQAERVYRIGYLESGSRSPLDEIFGQGLRERGYVEGQNLIIEWRFAQQRHDQLPRLAAELVQMNPDLIVSANDRTTAVLKEATTTIPIIVIAGHDLVKAGFAETLSRPGGNITGLSAQHLDIGLKHLELLKEVLPHLTRVGYLFRPNDLPLTALQVQRTQAAALSLGLTLRSYEVSSPSDLERVLSVIAKERPEALIGASEAFIGINHRPIAAFALANRLPLISYFGFMTRRGGLLSYGVPLKMLWKRAPYYVDKILQGANPATLPSEQLSDFKLIINLKTAKALGITIPPLVLYQATKVIR